ncbi:hypothetical protein F5X96DRAFT_650202 [Biscogniauxia mediterranea]|nr:hypothetical protein F5X96DRAFT_650202 [Biscogniauxia mediterranea]
MSNPHVLIVGAGLGGLTLAQVLRKQGVSFEIFERDPSEASRTQGWSLAIHTVLDDLLASTPDDMPPFRESVSAMHPIKVEDQLAIYIGGQRFGRNNSPETPFVRANRQRLRTWLATNINVQYGKFATKVEQSDDKITVFFQDGSSASGDVLVGADGTNSLVREHVLGKSNKDVLEYMPISSITAESIVLTGEAFERQLEVAHSFGFINIDSDSIIVQGLVKSLPGTADEQQQQQPGGEFHWILLWRDPITQHSGRSLVDTLPVDQRLSIARSMTQSLPEPLKHILHHTRPEHIRPTGWGVRDAVIDALPVSRTTLLGDAAHPTSPFRGEGAVNAMRDAILLGAALAGLKKDSAGADKERVHEALASYQAEMVPRGVNIVTGAKAQLGFYRHNWEKVRILGLPLEKLPWEKVEAGPEGVKVTLLD